MGDYADLLTAHQSRRSSDMDKDAAHASGTGVRPTTTPPAQSTGQSIGQSTPQLTDQSTPSPTPPTTNPVVSRPKAFYITVQLDRWLDEAVQYLRTSHGLRGVDRSTIINALLDDSQHWQSEALDRLVERVVNQLTERVTGRSPR